MADKNIPTLTDAAAITARVSSHIVQASNSREYSGAMGRWILLGGTYTSPGVWTQAADGSVSAVNFTGLGEAADILIICNAVTKSVSGQIVAHVSVDNGSNYFTTSGNYASVSDTGTLTNATGLFLHNTSSTAARNSSLIIQGANVTGAPKSCFLRNRGVEFIFSGSNSPINTVRVIPSAGGNFTGGTIYCFVRA